MSGHGFKRDYKPPPTMPDLGACTMQGKSTPDGIDHITESMGKGIKCRSPDPRYDPNHPKNQKKETKE